MCSEEQRFSSVVQEGGCSCFKIVCRDVGGIGLIDKHRKDVFANLLSDKTFGI